MVISTEPQRTFEEPSGSEDGHAWAATEEALQVYREHASEPGGRVALLAAAATQGDSTVVPALAALTTELLASLRA